MYNTSETEDGLKFNGKENSVSVNIPVVYITKDAAKKYLNDESATLDIKSKVIISNKKRTANNVIGVINNNAATTIIIGAHYDHLGYGEDGNSMLRSSGKIIHNGADDNASGTAAIIELAKLLKASRHKQNNYMFIAFSGEELGLFGSKYFTEHPTVELSTINYMINIDMIGRLNDSSRVVTVGGFGTTPAWGTWYNTALRKKLFTGSLIFKFDSSGTGPSDHTSFYRKNIPVLFYFTGLHNDYHKPTDDIDKINYVGEMQLLKHIFSIVEAQSNNTSKLVFTPTREVQTTTSARFSVTMGIMPDYTYIGSGVRIDGISEGRPAQKAGLKTGDVIIKLGDYKVTTVENYMQALGKFKKSDKTTVVFNRGKESLSVQVEF